MTAAAISSSTVGVEIPVVFIALTELSPLNIISASCACLTEAKSCSFTFTAR